MLPFRSWAIGVLHNFLSFAILSNIFLFTKYIQEVMRMESDGTAVMSWTKNKKCWTDILLRSNPHMINMHCCLFSGLVHISSSRINNKNLKEHQQMLTDLLYYIHANPKQTNKLKSWFLKTENVDVALIKTEARFCHQRSRKWHLLTWQYWPCTYRATCTSDHKGHIQSATSVYQIYQQFDK